MQPAVEGGRNTGGGESMVKDAACLLMHREPRRRSWWGHATGCAGDGAEVGLDPFAERLLHLLQLAGEAVIRHPAP